MTTTTDRLVDAGLLDLLGRTAVVTDARGVVLQASVDAGVRPGSPFAVLVPPASPRCWSPARLRDRDVLAWSVPLGPCHLVLVDDGGASTAPPVTLLVFAPPSDADAPLLVVEPLPSRGGGLCARVSPLPRAVFDAVVDGLPVELDQWLPYSGDVSFARVGEVVVGVLTPRRVRTLAGDASVPDLGDLRPVLEHLHEGVVVFLPELDGDELVALDIVYENARQLEYVQDVGAPRRMLRNRLTAVLFDAAQRAWRGEPATLTIDNRDGRIASLTRVLLQVRMVRVGDAVLSLQHDVADLARAVGERLRAEDLLARSLNQLPDQTCVCEPMLDAEGRVVDARVVYTNEAAGPELVGRLCSEVFFDPHLFLEAASQTWASNATVRYTFVHARPQGDVTFEATVARCGGVVLSTLADRTWEHTTQRALDESDRRYRMTAEALPLGVALLRVPGDPFEIEPELLYANPKMADSIGTDPTGRPMADVFPLWDELGRDLVRRARRAGGGVATLDIDNLEHRLTDRLPSCSLHLEARCSDDKAVVVVADRTREALAAREVGHLHERIERVLSSLDEAILVIDDTMQVVLDNDAARRMLRIDGPITMPRLLSLEAYDAAGHPLVLGQGPLSAAARSGEPVDGVIMQLRLPGVGGRLWLRMNMRILELEHGRRGVLLTATDITDTLLAEERFRSTIDVLEEAVSLYEPVFDEVGDLVDARILYLNPAARAYSTAPAPNGTLVSRRFRRFEQSLEVMREVWRTGRVGHHRIDNTDRAPDDPLRVKLFDVTVYRTGGLLVSVAVDRTPAVEAAQALALADQRFASTIEAIDEELAVFAPIFEGDELVDLRILYGNQSWHNGRDDSVPADAQLRVSEYYVDAPDFLAVARRAWTTGERQDYVLANPGRESFPQMKREHIEFSILRVGDEIVSVGLDRSAEQATLRRLVDVAAHDHETGLLSPNGLSSRLDDLLAAGTTIGLVVIEVGQLEQVQRSYGFRTADDAVREIAERLRHAAPGGPVARVGSSTFVVALPSVRRTTDVVAAAGELVALVQRPVEAGGVRLRLDASSGAVMSPLHGTDPDTLIRRAKSAAWAALRSHLRCTVWSAQLEQQVPTHEVALLSDIDRGLAHDEFFLDFQPKFDLRDLTLAGAEALVRWRHPTRGIVPPGSFIPLIEDSTLARPFTEHVIASAVRQWQARPEMAGLRVAVNLPAVLVNDPALVESITDALVQAGAPATMLELEITERGLVAGDAVVRANLDELRSLGAHLAIDDFGTGAASLSYLRWLPVESVKIDRTFVRDLAQDPVNRSVVEACVTVARALDLGVVAEGVETETEARVAAELGCGYAQGYLFGRPGPLDDVVARAARRG